MSISRRSFLQQGTNLVFAGGLLFAGLVRAAAPAAKAPAKAPPTVPATKPRANPYADAVFVNGAPPAIADGSFTVVVLPDTQHYSERFPATYHAQTEWIVAEQKKRNIAAVLHLGDVTNHNTPAEWKVAGAAMRKLDGHVPYFMCPGNHDYGPGGGAADRTSGFSETFPVAGMRDRPTFGGVYDREPDRTENSYHLFSAAGRDFLVICLEFGPRRDVVRWANEVAKKHPGRQAILVTHAYMYYDETIYDWKKYGSKQRWNPHGYKLGAGGDVSDGQELWDGLVSRHENFALTLNGHVLEDGLGRLVTATPAKRDIPQVLVNFQMKPNGGDGWLRLLEFKKDGTTVDVRDYSPTLNRQNESKQNRFEMALAPVKTV